MTVSLTVVIGIFCGYCLSIVLTNWLWSQKVQRLERYLVGQDSIIESLRAANDELHDAVFLIAQSDDAYKPISRSVH